MIENRPNTSLLDFRFQCYFTCLYHRVDSTVIKIIKINIPFHILKIESDWPIINFKMSKQPSCAAFASVQDIETPWDVALSSKYKRSFAYITAKDRWPVILQKVIDGLSNEREVISAQYGEQGKEDVENVLNYLLILKHDMTSDNCFINVVQGVDAAIYNKYLDKKMKNGSPVTWYSTEWLYAECYLYRRIKEAFLLSKTLGNYDPFHQQKTEAIEEALTSMEVLASFLLNLFENHHQSSEIEYLTFQRILKLSLWSNKADLSLSCGNRVEVQANPLKAVDELNDFILSDDSQAVWTEVSKSKNLIIDIVFDNTGVEVMTDLCLADYLTSMYNAVRVRFHCKAIPWFISDVMEKDFHQVIERLSNHTPACQQLAARWHDYLENGKWTVHSDCFWTLPFSYNEMKEQDPKLHSMLAESSIIIFKGDLNYRKLLGDINWKYTTPFHAALRGFNPAPIVALRTAKADLIAGKTVWNPGCMNLFQLRTRTGF
ncbi:damage-control phosphatase ARMT1-like isoform X2 [Macrosteles quadrilineatus]|uniref:damage-control phosphatase ARMT1-like isoform X2 n=1 Tax=Macrosteles quadrilineatus TaxID=74068 RepID=UPI0023E18C65|nr:damage-control phosphatase ARMT1-like isoform X2 [Macrosteles quadrilineatus]